MDGSGIQKYNTGTLLRRKIKILFPNSLITDWVYMHYTTQIWV
jgi:hypothetical protein